MAVEHAHANRIRAQSARIRDVVARTRDIVVAARELLSRPAPDTFAGRRTHKEHINVEQASANRRTLAQVSSLHGVRSCGGQFCDEGDATMSGPSLVLVVEDEYFLLADLEEALTDAGYAVQIASSGEDALTLFIGGTVA
jgi:hypothetical protein